MRSFVSSLWMMNLVLPTVSFGRVWCKYYLYMDLLTKHDDADNWDSVPLTIDDYTIFVLPMIHILPATYAKKLNEIPTHWTVRLSIPTFCWTMYLTLIYELSVWFDDCIHSMNPLTLRCLIVRSFGLNGYSWRYHRLPYLKCDLKNLLHPIPLWWLSTSAKISTTMEKHQPRTHMIIKSFLKTIIINP